MKLCLYFLLFCGLAMSEEVTKCGQYGFRCTDPMTFEICSEPDSDGNVDPPVVRQCPLETRCNEDDPAYCSATENSENLENCPNKIRRNSKKHKEDMEVLGFFNDGALYRVHEENVLDFSDDSDENEEEESITEQPDNQDDSESCEETYTEPPAMNCDMYGFFPDNDQKELFYFCDLEDGAKGFILRHMQCNKGRVFDPIHRECVLPGTTRNIRDEEEELSEDEQKEHTLVDVEESSNHHGFNCSGRDPGKFPDSKNCHLYHLCLPIELYSPFEKLTVQCPKRTAYDPASKTCTKAATSRCFQKQKSNNTITTSNINCKSEMRFRERRNCDQYFICYKDQVLKIKCPNDSKYNSKYARCMPAHFFKCD